MLTTKINLPTENTIPAMPVCMDAAIVLGACRDQLFKVDETERNKWRAARMIEALYHPGRYARVVYVLLADESTEARRHWPEGTLVYLHTPVRQPMSRRGIILRIGGHEIEAYAFPNDRRLRSLRTFAGRNLCAKQWQRWNQESGDDSSLEIDSLQRLLVRYVPEQKWVVRLRAEFSVADSPTTTKRRIAVRCASSTSIAKLRQCHQGLAHAADDTDEAFTVPRVIGCDIERGLLAVEWIRGATLIEALGKGDPGPVLASVARRLHRFHASSAEGLLRLTNKDVMERVRHAIDDLRQACPSLVENLNHIEDELRQSFSEAGQVQAVTLHNDFHFNQFAIKRDRFALFDLERMARGDALIDVANFATQLEMLGHRAEQPVNLATASQWREHFLAAWANVTKEPIDAARFHRFAVLSRLELARGMMRHLRPGWDELAAGCVQLALDDMASMRKGGDLP